MGATAVLKLQKSGFTSEQVEALADFLDGTAATKIDILASESRIREEQVDSERKLEGEIQGVEKRLNERIDAVERKLEGEIQGVERRLGDRIDMLERKMEEKLGALRSEQLVIRWMVGSMLALQIAIFLKLFIT